MKRHTRTLSFPPLDRDYSILALRPPLIAGMVTPVENGDGGVNLSMVTDNDLGLLTAIDPWQRMAEGDHLDIYWENQRVASRDVEAADVDQRLIFFLPSEPIVPDWAERVFYRLTRAGSSTAEDSVPLRLRVKLDLPAGVDKDPHLPGHSELAAPRLPQDVIDNGVDASWAARGVPAEIAAYPGRAAHDTIELQWGDATLTHRVTEAEAAGTAPIVITVDQAAILAGGDSPNLLVQYQVFDEVWNFSTEWSLRTYVDVEADAQRLTAPIINESVNGIIDLGQLGSADVTVQIEVRGAPFERNDTVTLTWKGTTSAGVVREYRDSLILTNIPSVVEIPVPNAEIRAIRDGSGMATYVLTKANGDPPQSSKRATARVTGKIPLPAPWVYEAVGDTLDPTLERVHVEIPVYDKMASGDLIDVIWLGTRQNGTPYLYEAQHFVSSGEVGEPIYIAVTEEHIALLANGTLDLSYQVSNDDPDTFNVRASDHLYLGLHPRHAELPAPSVDEASEGVLDPEKITDYATYRMPYTGTVAGDILTWYWQGESLEGSASDWLPITSAIAGKPFTFNIPRTLIEPNINNIVKLYYSLQLASTGAYQYSAVLDLTIGKLIGDLPTPQVLEAAGGTLNPMQAQTGATVRVQYASMDPQDIITLSWLGTPGVGSPPDQQAAGSASGQVDFSVPASVIGANIGQRVSVAYQVKRYVTEKQSEILLLNISTLPDSELPTPIITQANAQTKVLNLATFAGNATTTVAVWPFIATGQRAWLRLEGETASGGPHSIVLLNGEALTSAQAGAGLSQSVLRAELEKYGQDTALNVICNVAFSGINDEVAALPLPVMKYLFKLHHDWVTPVIVSVRDSKGEVANDGTTFDTTLDLSGTGTFDTELEILDGTTALVTVRTDGDGNWSASLTGLLPKGYSVTAKALDGSGLVSQPRTYEVLANVTPVIEQVVDSRGPISNGGGTVDTAVTISGNASPDQEIDLLEGTEPLGRARTDALGAWSLRVENLKAATHVFKAKARYGTEPESTPWRLVVAANVTPTITSVKAGNDEVPPGGFTIATRVVLTGKASAGFDVQIFDGSASQGNAAANASGVWTLTLDNLAVAAHAIKAKALYGGGDESAVRSFTVVSSVSPTLTSVKDSRGVEVPDNTSTVDNNFRLTGTASAHLQIEVFDGTVSQGKATANDKGIWELPLNGLAVTTHRIKARALYGEGEESAVRTFTVIASVAPTITSVKAGNDEVPPGGFTIATRVVLTGKASAGFDVQIFDGSASQGNATANASGVWTLTLDNLAVAAHAIKAKALYGGGDESAVRSFTVVSSVTPNITNVKDSRGTEIPDNGSTVDTNLSLTGTASASLQVDVLDGSTSLGKATANASGVWGLQLNGLAVSAHSVKARALYGDGAESRARTFTIFRAVTPRITSVKTTVEIPQGGFTVDTKVTLRGTAGARDKVEILDGGALQGHTYAESNGQWQYIFNGLSVATHRIRARAPHGAESAERTFTVVAVVTPVITAVLDPANNPVSNGGATFANRVTVSGRASSNHQIELLDGGDSKGLASTDSNGNWSREASGLALGGRSLTAKGYYADNPVSSAWTFTVKELTVPTLTSVRDSKGEVGDTTTDTTVTASGKAAANEQVEVFDGGDSKGKVSVNGNGDWSHAVPGLALGAHSLKAVAQYGSGASSNVRTFTVVSQIPPFVLDPSIVSLNGRVYRLAGYGTEPVSWPGGTTYARVPSSGVPPYTYTSSNPSVVIVNANGTIFSNGNGNATITVRDAQGRSGSYGVNVSNVIEVVGLGRSTWKDANSAAGSRGKRIPSHDELNQIAAMYLGRWPMGGGLYWSTTAGAGLYTKRCKDLASGGWGDVVYIGLGSAGNHANVVAI
ncbi:hypothetical protein [Pseudomonas sp. RC10]|uniref:hypothetical protein n=1 Tax=Pseudomonas bambusae TaxID=3139142 RepID=UPI0031388C7E